MDKRAVPRCGFLVAGLLMFGAVLISVISIRSRAQNTSAVPPAFSNVDDFVRKQMKAQKIPGLSVSVIREGKFLYEAAYGFADLERQIKVTTRTPFYTASVTKAFTGTSLFLLEREHKIDFDQPVNDYLSSAKLYSPMWDVSAATVRRVANHTAGLTTYNRKCNVGDLKCMTSTTNAIERHGILFWPPGNHFDYSNLGYGALGEVIAETSGKPFDQFMERELFAPMNMHDCYLQTSPELRAGSSFNYDPGTLARTPLQTSDTPGASSARCSSHDLAAFGSFILGSPVPGQRRILSTKELQELLYSDSASAGEKYSFGWDRNVVEGYPGVFAQGGTYDSFALLQLIPEKRLAIAIVANTGTTLPFEIANRIVAQLLPPMSSPPSPEKPVTNDGQPLISGTWSGYIQIDDRKVSLNLKIESAKSVEAKIGETVAACAKVELTSRRIDCVAKNGQNASEFPSGMPDVELELYLRGDKLIGAATSQGPVQLPYWVTLEQKGN